MERIIAAFGELPTTCVSDAMQGMNNLDPAIKPLQPEGKICGRAFPVKMSAGDNMAVLKGIRQARPGDILVVDAKGYLYAAAAGDFVVGLAHTMGLGGMVVDGTIRDIAGIRKLGFPVFCRGTTVACSKKIGDGEIGVPVSCGGVSISPGDIVVGDVDGVVVVPQAQAQAVLAAAGQKLRQDQARAAKVLGRREAAASYIDDLTTEK